VALLFVGGALTFVYLFQIYQHTYWRPGQEQPPAPAGARVVVAVLAAVVLAVGLWPEPLLALSNQAGDALTRMAG
jgi:multicomponent Na+:H+ antiporter subunit D